MTNTSWCFYIFRTNKRNKFQDWCIEISEKEWCNSNSKNLFLPAKMIKNASLGGLVRRVLRLEPPIQVRQVGVSHMSLTDGWDLPVGWLLERQVRKGVGWLVDINTSNKPLNICPGWKYPKSWWPVDGFSPWFFRISNMWMYRLKKVGARLGEDTFSDTFPVRAEYVPWRSMMVGRQFPSFRDGIRQCEPLISRKGQGSSDIPKNLWRPHSGMWPDFMPKRGICFPKVVTNPPFPTGNTSKFMVDDLASYVSLLWCNIEFNNWWVLHVIPFPKKAFFRFHVSFRGCW